MARAIPRNFLLPAAAAAFAAACAGAPAPAAHPDGHHGSRAGEGSGNPPSGSAATRDASSHPDYGPGDSDDDHRDSPRAPRALLFRAAGFPTVDAPGIDDGVLDAALSGLPVDRASNVGELVSRLKLRDIDVLVLPYGSAFPLEAWPRIRT